MPRAAPVLMLALGFVMVLIFKIAFYFRMFYKVAPQVMPIYKGGTKCLRLMWAVVLKRLSSCPSARQPSEEIFGGNEAGLKRGFRVRQSQGVIEVTLSKRELVTPPLATEPLLLEREGNSPVGYLNLRSFISTATGELSDAMGFFATPA